MENHKNVRIVEFQKHDDERGNMVVAECGTDIPFEVKRFFYIYGSDTDVVRGQHANRKTQFLLINVSGTSKVKIYTRGGGGGGSFLFGASIYGSVSTSYGMEGDV